ncbi:hypothetical protein BH10ACI4_BH10ACI4_09590 [soil metagenome]
MGLLNRKDSGEKYHARDKANPSSLPSFTDEELEKCASDPNCIEQEICAYYLTQRKAKREKDLANSEDLKKVRDAALLEKRDELMINPFDPRTEVSADAKHIASRVVTHLWILFVMLPVVLGILLALTGGIK